MSTFDLSAEKDNILNIISDLQRRVAELETANVQANSLDEIAPDGGALDSLVAGNNTIDANGVHTAANLVDILWWLPLTIQGDDVTAVYALAIQTIGSTQYLYAGGEFTRIGGTDVKNIARYNFSSRAWEAVDDGSLNGAVRAIAFDGSNILHVGGDFTNASGNASADYIAKLSGSTWTSVGDGLNGTVRVIVIYSGVTYIGGDFTNAGVDTSADYVAKLTAGLWTNIGGGVNAKVNAIAFDSSGVMYIGGAFTDAGGDASADYIAKLSGGAWVNVGGGITSEVKDIAIDDDDNVYIGGTFSMRKLDDGAWVEIGDGLDDTVYSIAINEITGNIYASGAAILSATGDTVAVYDGKEWAPLSNAGAVTGGLVSVYDITIDETTGNVYAGGAFSTAGTMKAEGVAVYAKPLSDAIDLIAATFDNYYALYSSGVTEDVVFVVDGALAVCADAAPAYLFTRSKKIDTWYIYGETPGSAGSTIFDVHKAGTTIWTVQADRPTLAWDDADKIATAGTPSTTEFSAGDVLTLQIDQVATGAQRFLLVGKVVSSYDTSGGGSLTVEEDGHAGVGSVTKITFDGSTVVDQGGGHVKVTAYPQTYIDFDVATSEAGATGNRTSGGSYSSHQAYVQIGRPLKLNQVKWDVAANVEYTLKIYKGYQFVTAAYDLGTQTASSAPQELTWSAGDIYLSPGFWVFQLTTVAGQQVRDNTADSPERHEFWECRIVGYGSSVVDLGYSAAMRLVAYLGTEVLNA